MESNVLRYYLKKETQIFRSKLKSNALLYKVQQKYSDYVTFNALKVTKSSFILTEAEPLLCFLKT